MESLLQHRNNIWFTPVNKLIDLNVWIFLQWYYIPYKMITQGDDVDKFISQFTLNGFKSFNICRK